jgi:hypothetical protein
LLEINNIRQYCNTGTVCEWVLGGGNEGD